MKTKNPKPKKPRNNKDKIIAKELEEWDIVECKICGERISMRVAQPVNGGEYFICKGH